MTEARPRTMLLTAAGLLLVGSVALFGSHRCSSDAVRSPPSGRVPARAAELAGASVSIECRVVEVPPASLADPSIAAVVDGFRTSSSSLDAEESQAITASIEALVTAKQAAVLSAPRVLVRSGESAAVALASTQGPSQGIRFELGVEFKPVARQDGTIDLAAAFTAKRLEGGAETLLDDLGVPVGERAAGRGVLTVSAGGAAIWTRTLGDSVIVVVARPRVGE